MKNPLSESQLTMLVEAIQQAEMASTGEIRIHIDTSEDFNLAQEALDIFHDLGMQNTKDRNAVLFYLNFSQKYLTIIGDQGIHAKVCQDFWDSLHDQITQQFAQGNYFEPLQQAILRTGEELKKYFPASHTQENELPDEITFS